MKRFVIITFVAIIAVSLVLSFLPLGSIFRRAPEATQPNKPPSPKLNMTIVSPAFKNNEFIPKKHSCDGENINPELLIGDVPDGAVSLALIVDDPDAPNGTFTHWTLWNINPDVSVIKENSVPVGLGRAELAGQGKTGFGRVGYGGPCPPMGNPHRYHFKIFALDNEPTLMEGIERGKLEAAMEGHVIDRAELVGLYKR